MSDKRETADAIIDEMRDCARAADPSIWGGAAIQKLVENTKRQQLAYCDRLEASLERERAQVGNKAAWRAALVKIRYYLPHMVQYMRIHWEDANAGGYFEKISSIIDAALAAPARACDYMNDPVDVIKAKWDAQFYKRCGVFPPLTRVIARQTAHAAIEAWFEPMTEDGADAEGGNE